MCRQEILRSQGNFTTANSFQCEPSRPEELPICRAAPRANGPRGAGAWAKLKTSLATQLPWPQRFVRKVLQLRNAYLCVVELAGAKAVQRRWRWTKGRVSWRGVASGQGSRGDGVRRSENSTKAGLGAVPPAGVCTSRSWIHSRFDAVVERQNKQPVNKEPLRKRRQRHFALPTSNDPTKTATRCAARWRGSMEPTESLLALGETCTSPRGHGSRQQKVASRRPLSPTARPPNSRRPNKRSNRNRKTEYPSVFW